MEKFLKSGLRRAKLATLHKGIKKEKERKRQRKAHNVEKVDRGGRKEKREAEVFFPDSYYCFDGEDGVR